MTTKTATKWKRKAKYNRHAFRFKLGTGHIMTHWARVIPAKMDVYLTVKAEHVRESIRLGGVGNTQTCTMATCASRQRECFPHNVEGYIDWFYSRAYVVSKIDKNGLPSECYEYAHSSKIAQLNDSRGGQKKLLAELEASGERIVHLRPVTLGAHKAKSPPKGRRDGSRTKVQPRGAKLRFAVAQMGGVPV